MSGKTDDGWKRFGRWAWMGIIFAMAGSAFGTDYTISEYKSYRKLYTTNAFVKLMPNQQAWATSNANMEWTGGALEPMRDASTNLVYPRSPEVLGKKIHQLDANLYGYPFERIRPDYYLGDAVDVPPDVDWAATYLAFMNACAAESNLASQIFFDQTTPAIYFAAGGGYQLEWCFTDETTSTQSYNIASTSDSRPYRIFWTSHPYNAAPVDLSGKSVKLLGNPGLFEIQEGAVTNYSSLGGVMVSTQIVSGVYLDTSLQQLHAAGQLAGQFLLVYYDSGNYERVLDVIVVEVCAPVIKQKDAYVGDQLFPSGDGYAPDGLHVYQYSSTALSDGFGPYLYQHQGQYPYSAKNMGIFSIRPTQPTTVSLAEVYWAETDSQNVSWPFECNHYLSTWSPATPRFVRGNKAARGGAPIYVSQDYVVELMTYQEPDNARFDAVSKSVYAINAGYSLLKLQANDNIWFQPIRSVMNTEGLPDVYTWPIGQELRPTAAIANVITADIPAYLYAEGSSLNYNPNIYIAPSAEPDGSLPKSALYFVNTNGNMSTPLLEAWWYKRVQQEGMPTPLDIPSRPAWYSAVWPETNATLQIVLASQLGGLGKSLLLDAESGLTNAVLNAAILADETPIIYAQNHSEVVGYNPNEEHALIRSGGGGYVPWAIRCDLNLDSSSKSAVLTQYVQDNQYKMTMHYVVLTNALYPALGADMVAGTVLPGPHPLDFLATPWQSETDWDNRGPGNPAFRDRKGVVWARCEGQIDIRMFYPMQSGFWFPSLVAASQPAIGEAVPWLARVTNAAADVLTNSTPSWTWNVQWPADVPEMKIGQTLTTAAAGLPEVWGAKSLGVVYPNPTTNPVDADQTAMLYDPTVIQTSGFSGGNPLADFGFDLGDNGNVLVREGKYYFRDLPPSISGRFYYDPGVALDQCLCLMGKLEASEAGADILYVNVLDDAERQALKDIVPDGADNKSQWDVAIDALATVPVLPSAASLPTDGELAIEYLPVDHYALTAMGGTNYVVLVENDATNPQTGVQEGDAISMHLFQVQPQLYAGRVVTREDPNNLLSQRLDILYTEMLGGMAGDFIFEWKMAPPNANGTIPMDYVNVFTGYVAPTQGLTRITLGGQGSTLADLVNTYYVMRYQARTGTVAYASVGDEWSTWCGPALAEGWVQRVLNAITPFAQRMQDLYENPAETAISMLAQIGGPYEGDVVLNQDNLTSVGLIQLYKTVLNKAESLSLLLGIDNGEANKQLLLAVERLADLYMVLGNEAYVDAMNPTVGIGNDFVYGSVDYGALSSSLYCFQNQQDSLLDEELSLLRGRSLVNAPDNHQSPYFNRLLWNFTTGITAGEVAYVVNYGIDEKTGDAVLDANDAARMYPQGHGDAWGHYLSALKGYYRLLRNPNFSWGEISMGEMNLADVPVNVDYDDESRFAQAAAALAKTGADIVDRTARKAWADGGASGSGYLDTDANRAFGYGDWGTRSGLGAFYNWAVANSILPPAPVSTNGLGGDFDDDGLLNIHRGSVLELSALATYHDALQIKVDRLDRGQNPLGFSDHAIPFDISAEGIEDGSSSHFEQILGRAEVALKNAHVILDRAQTLGNALRQLQDTEASYEDALDNQEQGYQEQLISIFGYPFAGDIGPSGTYVQGYDGPDLYHYMWMDLSPYGFSELDLATVTTNIIFVASNTVFDAAHELNFVTNEIGTVAVLPYRISASGLLVKPAKITGFRRASGRVQGAYRDFLPAYVNVKNKLDANNRTYDAMISALDLAACAVAQEDWEKVNQSLELTRLLKIGMFAFKNVTTGIKLAAEINEAMSSVFDGGPFLVAAKAAFAALKATLSASENAATMAANYQEFSVTLDSLTAEMDAALSGYGDAVSGLAATARAAIQAHAESAYELNNAWGALQEPLEQMNTILAEGERLLEARAKTRTQAVSILTKARYSDMFFRLNQNESLARYGMGFDLAQQYTWLAAKAYDYETGRLTADAAAGADFLGSIVASRSLGVLNGDEPMLGGETGDPGLSDILARMKANWLVLKPRLGINNPQPYTTWFSLRQGLFRILPGAAGDAAWSLELSKHWVDDLLALPEFKRYCQAFSPTQAKEPGLVIPFSTTIEAARNLFGLDLAGGDSAYDSTYFATKIAAAGIQFVDYNALSTDYDGTPALSQTPVVYLMPLGTDRMRDPGDLGTVLDYHVMDQVMPVPFAIGSQSLASADWTSIYNSLTGVTNGVITIRRYPSFRASIAASDGDDIKAASKRLIGRSVWNTHWVLIIPAVALGTDRESALTTFIRGRDFNRDGSLDQLPVRDVQIGLRTYSNSGN